MWFEGRIQVLQLPYLALGLAGAAWSWKKNKDKRQHLGLLIAVILYFWGMTIAVLSIVRYMVPAMPFVVVFSAVGLDAVIARVDELYSPSGRMS